MSLGTVWFVIIAVLWSGYFLLEGFDFGVGMLLPILPLGGSERERGIMFESIGPVWDGNEVWLVIAGGATFAAFPLWYASLFSGLYLALLLILVCLIVRVVSFEWRGKQDSARWRTGWLWANTIGSVGATFLWGVALANFVHGVPLNSSHTYTGTILNLFSGYTVLGGITFLSLFAAHGALYLSVRTAGDFRERAAALATRLLPAAAVLAVAFVAWTVVVAHNRNARGVLPTLVPAALTTAVLILAIAFAYGRRTGRAFAMTGLSAIGLVATIFTGLYPRVLVSNPTFTNSITVANAATGHYALKVMTIAAAILTPVILLYQGWTYYVFRKRLSGETVGVPTAAAGRGGDGPSA